MIEYPGYGECRDEGQAEKQTRKTAGPCFLMCCRHCGGEGRGALVCRIVGDGFYAPATDDRDIGEKPVAAASDGLDEAGMLGGITQRFSDLADCFVEAGIEIDGSL